MERLTKRTIAGVANINYSGCQFEDGERDKIAESARRQAAIERLAAIEDILGETYDLDRLRELVKADSDGRCMVLPFKPHKAMWSCSKSNPKPAKAYYATEMGILADMKAGCVFGETAESAEAALAKEWK